MKAPATDGCDNRAPQSPTTSLVRHFTSDPQTRSVTLLTIPRRPAAEPHRTGRHASRTHTHTHTDPDLSLSSPGVESGDATGVASPTPKRASAPQKGRHATQPNRKPERGRVLLLARGTRTRTPIQPRSEPRGFRRRPPCTRCRATHRAGNHRPPLTKDRASVAQ
jgi:hypothetical protein